MWIPLAPLRSVRERLTPSMETLAQSIAERVTGLVVDALDVNALLERVDLNAVLDRVDIDGLLDRVDIDRLLARADVNAIVQRVDVNEVVSKVDVEAVMDRVDVNSVVDRIDIDALVEQTDLGAVIARSSGGVATGALDVVRSQTVGLDEFLARWVGRLRRHTYTGPPGPPDRLRLAAWAMTAPAGECRAPGRPGRRPGEPPGALRGFRLTRFAAFVVDAGRQHRRVRARPGRRLVRGRAC